MIVGCTRSSPFESLHFLCTPTHKKHAPFNKRKIKRRGTHKMYSSASAKSTENNEDDEDEKTNDEKKKKEKSAFTLAEKR